jgi:hypothetical protein
VSCVRFCHDASVNSSLSQTIDFYFSSVSGIFPTSKNMTNKKDYDQNKLNGKTDIRRMFFP